MTTSGSWRSTFRSADPKVSPILGCMAIWLSVSCTISIGSSRVTMFTRGDCRWESEVYSVVVFPLPVGPTTKIKPEVCASIPPVRRQLAREEPEVLEVGR